MNVANDLVAGGSVGKTCNLFSHSTRPQMENGTEALRSKLGVSMENQTTTFIWIASNHRASQSKEAKDQAPNRPAFAADANIELRISVLAYTCLPLVTKKETFGNKRT
jgi:hypothetical protein